MPSDSKRDRLPFEPRKNNQKKPEKTAPAAPKSQTTTKSTKSSFGRDRANANLSAIPDVVSKRMGRRMAVFCGIPSIMGMASLLVFYWVKTNNIIDLPPYVALAVSFGFLGLGVLGLSYGLFSSCWDEDRVGSLLGIDELKINLGRAGDAWRASRQKTKPD